MHPLEASRVLLCDVSSTVVGKPLSDRSEVFGVIEAIAWKC